MATFYYIVIFLIFNVVNCDDTNKNQQPEINFVSTINIGGSHHDIGYNIGFTFQHIIKDFFK